MECGRREWSGVHRKFCYDREVVRGSAQGRGERRCKGSVTGGNNKVKCVISIVGWEIDMLGEVKGRKNRKKLTGKVIRRVV